MAFITVLARHKTISTYHLSGVVTVGRSMDADLYLPDVFISRRHCRFEQRNGSWHVRDLGSRNGVWHLGKRERSFLLKPGDVIELGTIALRYNEGTPEEPSHPAPFGLGVAATELMETVYAHDLRPSEYTRLQKSRRIEWVMRVKERIARSHDRDVEVPPIVDHEPWKREEWAELDMELQIASAQELMTDWEAPIFNPKRNSKAAAEKAVTDSPAGRPRELPLEPSQRRSQSPSPSRPGRREPVDYSLAATSSKPKRPMDSIDEEVEERTRHLKSTSASAPQEQPADDTYDGVQILPYTWRDRLKDQLAECAGRGAQFAKRNPAIAVGAVLAVAVLIGLVYKYKPESGPHYYVPPEAGKVLSAR